MCNTRHESAEKVRIAELTFMKSGVVATRHQLPLYFPHYLLWLRFSNSANVDLLAGFFAGRREGRTRSDALARPREADPNEACKLLVTSSKIGTDGQDIKRGGSSWAERTGTRVEFFLNFWGS